MTEKILTARFEKPDSYRLSSYVEDGGYEALKKALSKTPDEIIDIVKAAGLRGRGGAGFPAGVKWSFVPKESEKPKYLCVNGDEGEPGTFKDRYIMELDPHAIIEGAAIASYAFGAHVAYIYIRGEFKLPIERVENALAEARQAGFLGANILDSGYDLDIWVHPGAGAYVCGEETALIESNEGHRGMPRIKPPFPAIVGLFGGPTVVNNIETLSYVPHIINKGPEWFAAMGPEKNGGTKLFGVSGHVKRPGLYELRMGTPLRKIIYEVCGGMRGDKELKAVIPGGSSTPILTPGEIDVNMDYDSLAKIGTMFGSGAIIVIEEGTCIPRLAARLAKFYAHESCGQCTPCREGVPWIAKILDRVENGMGLPGDLDQVLKICDNIQGKTICPLGDACAMPIRAMIVKFRAEFERHVEEGGCPFGPTPTPWDSES
ncbi:MAG: NADH-quinone oxidoreductase subunit NuoF [Deltaproteobacteria bacterium]|nr:NADH-quinone oxidoreductase subunit NuoF [Deltaproteobacteria bacterium]